MLGGVLARLAPVEQRRAGREQLLDALRRERLERRRVAEQRPAVERDDAREVRRLRRKVPRQLVDERVLALEARAAG